MRILIVTLLLTVPTGAAAQAVRAGLVAMSDDAPVVIESTMTVQGRLHGRVRLRNVSDRPIAAVTLAVTIGPPVAGAPVYRRTQTVSAALPPHAAADLEWEGVSEPLVVALIPSGPPRDVELAVLGVTWTSGTEWRVRSATTPWLGRTDRPGTLQCLDNAGDVHQVGAVAWVGGRLRQCAADGQLLGARD